MRLWILTVVIGSALGLRAEGVATWEAMDYGQWLASSVTLPWAKGGEDLDGIVLKGITFQLGKDAACFDTGELRWACAVTDGQLHLMGTPFDGTHRPPEQSRPALTGTPILATSHGVGWTADGDWRDLRSEPYVPVAKERAHFLGLIRADHRAVLHYSVGTAIVYETPFFGSIGSQRFLVRSIGVSPHAQTLSLLVGEDRLEYRNHVGFDGRYPEANSKEVFLGRLAASVDSLPSGAQWKILNGNRLVLELPPSDLPIAFSLMSGHLTDRGREQWRPTSDPSPARTVASLASAKSPRDAQVTWAPRFGTAPSTSGRMGTNSGAYAVDFIPLPTTNRWNSWMRPSGFDFFAGGRRAALCTWSGDVWLADGLTGDLNSITWRRIAAGLFQPLGLRIVDEKVYVLCRDQIARLDDFDGDGEPDEITNFNNDVSVTPNFHEFALDLQADSKGNFYFTKGGPLLGTEYWDPIGAHNGCVLRVSSDGRTLDRFATGLRAPNGSGMSPRDELVCSDNEGIWTPVCRLNWVQAGGFYGAMGLDHRDPHPLTSDTPLCWLPYALDNSSGSQVWADQRFGPLGGELIHLSYGKCRAFHVLKQDVRGVIQGGVVPLPWRFDSSAMRGRANPADGTLWIAGMKGWQTTAALDGALHRVRWVGGSFPALMGFRVLKDGFELQFTEPMDPSVASDPTSWSIQWWNYLWSQQYGSDLYSVSRPGMKTGRKGELKGDEVPVIEAVPSPDHRSVRLKISDLQPVMQLAVRASLRTDGGAPLPLEYYGTINAVPHD